MNQTYDHISPDLDGLLAGMPTEEAEGLRAVWDQIGSDEPTDFPDRERIARVWRDLEAFSHGTISHEPRPAVRLRRLRLVRRPVSMALTAVVLAGAVAVALWIRPAEWTAPLGERLAVALPDGSKVELNSGASLHYARPFRRSVHLVGEAYFDVNHNGKPFLVHTFNAEVQVLGTHFNVRAWPTDDAPTTVVTLASGKVSVAPAKHLDRAVIMTPGETRQVVNQAAEVAAAETNQLDDVLAWRHGDLIFKNQMLSVILKDLERRFALRINLQPAGLGSRRINLAFRNPLSAESVIKDLCVAMGLAYSRNSDGYEIHSSSGQ